MIHPRALVLALCFCAASALASTSLRPQDPAVQNFNNYFKEYSREYGRAGKDEDRRAAAIANLRETILTLLGVESPEVVPALVSALKIEESEVQNAALRVLGGFQTRPPVDALLAALSQEKQDAVIALMLEAFERGKYAGSLDTLRPLLANRMWQVRRRAILALASLKDPATAPVIAGLANDREAAVRCAVLDGLAEMGSDAVLQLAMSALADPVWQVRASAIHALALVRKGEALGPLVAALEREDGRLQVDLVATLENLTGFFYGQDLERWKELSERSGGRFPVPSMEAVEELRRRARDAKKPRTGAAGDALADESQTVAETMYHGIETPSRSILFVIDVSGSMENEVVEKDRFRDGNYPSMTRFDIVKTELLRTIARLEPNVNFNVQAFATEVRWWKPKLQAASEAGKSAAMDWVRRLAPIGGASKEELARVGLTDSANLDGGQTNSFAALMGALGVTDKSDRDYAVTVDTVFFLSDGRPSTGDYVEPEDILRVVGRENELRKVVIHTIALGEFQKDFMQRLAEQNGGVFVDLGR